MNRETFLTELRQRLSGLPREELEERLAFYGEMLDDRLEDGLTEEEAVESLGTPDEVAAQVLAEIPMAMILREKVRPKRRMKAWEIVLLILGSPIWFSLLVAGLAVGFSLYVVLWVIVFSLWVVALALGASALGCLFGAGFYLFRGRPGEAGFFLGACLVCVGLTLLWIALSLALTKGAVKMTTGIWPGIKARLTRKEEAE